MRSKISVFPYKRSVLRLPPPNMLRVEVLPDKPLDLDTRVPADLHQKLKQQPFVRLAKLQIAKSHKRLLDPLVPFRLRAHLKLHVRLSVPVTDASAPLFLSLFHS